MGERLDRTQEVAGSIPASSIGRKYLQIGRFFSPRNGRRLEAKSAKGCIWGAPAQPDSNSWLAPLALGAQRITGRRSSIVDESSRSGTRPARPRCAEKCAAKCAKRLHT
jgi:hypothetical protein